MGKAIGALVRFIAFFILLAAVSYNTWTIRQLRQEVELLKSNGKNPAARAKPTGNPAELAAQARQHYDRAQALLANKEYMEAARELTRAAEKAQAARDSAGAMGEQKMSELGKAIQSLSEKTQNLIPKNDTSGKVEDSKTGEKVNKK